MDRWLLELWKLACADARVDPRSVHLSAFPGTPSRDLWGFHARPGIVLSHEPFTSLELAQIDDARYRRLHRVAVFTGGSREVTLALMRHELEHVRQADGALDVYLAAIVIRDSLGPVYHPHGAGGASILNTFPFERDANAAAARLVRDTFGQPDDQMLMGEHGALFREPAPPEPIDTLGSRLLAFASLHPESLDAYCARFGPGLGKLLRDLHQDGPELWIQLLSDKDLGDRRAKVAVVIPTPGEIQRQGTRPARAWESAIRAVFEAYGRAWSIVAPASPSARYA